jgi:hypothetical protein
MTDPTPTFEGASVAAWLVQRSRTDQKELLDELVTTLSAAVPGVEVERSLLRRQIIAVRLPLGGYSYVLKKNSNGTFDSTRQQIVHGVAIRTVSMEIDAFLAELGLALDVELRRTEKGRAALQEFLNPKDG